MWVLVYALVALAAGIFLDPAPRKHKEMARQIREMRARMKEERDGGG
jgi:uncharacterized protein YjeT (DUF2065 family)